MDNMFTISSSYSYSYSYTYTTHSSCCLHSSSSIKQYNRIATAASSFSNNLRRPSQNNSNNNDNSNKKKKKTNNNPKPIKASPKPSENPLKLLLNNNNTPPITPPNNITNHLWLTSKLNPPPPPLRLLDDDDDDDCTNHHVANSSENEVQEEFKQQGKIFVGNLPAWIKKNEFAQFFRQFGPIQNVILIKAYNHTDRNLGFGFVIYGGPNAATCAIKAVEFDGVDFHGRILTVKLDDGRKSKARAQLRDSWVAGEDDGLHFSSKWHQHRHTSRLDFKTILETQPHNWQAVVTAFHRIDKVLNFSFLTLVWNSSQILYLASIMPLLD